MTMATNLFYCFVLLILTIETMAYPTDRSRTVWEGAVTRGPDRGNVRLRHLPEVAKNPDLSTTTVAFPDPLSSTSFKGYYPVPKPSTGVSRGRNSSGLLTRIMNTARDNANENHFEDDSTGVTINSESTVSTGSQNNTTTNSATPLPNQETSSSLDTNGNDSIDFQQDGDHVTNLNHKGNVASERHLPPALRGTGCSQQMCEKILRLNRKESRSRPPPVPLKANNRKQIEQQRHVIVQYNDLLSTTSSEGQLPPIPRNQAIVNLTGEEDDEVMGKFGSFFHNIEDVPPSESNFRRGNDRPKRGTNVYVCAHERSWEDIVLAFSSENGLVQVYQTDMLRQYVLTNRCTESRSSVVPDVVCVNDISTVNVIVVNFDSGLIEPTFINVETCRAKFVT